MSEIIVNVPKRKKNLQIIKSEEVLNDFLEEKKEKIKQKYGVVEFLPAPIVYTAEGLEEIELEEIKLEKNKDEVIFDIDLSKEKKNISNEISANLTLETEKKPEPNIIKIEDIEVKEEYKETPNNAIFTEIYTITNEKEPIKITTNIKDENLINAEKFTEHIQTAYQNGYNDAKEVALLDAKGKIIEAHNFIRRIDSFMLELRKHYAEQINSAKDKITNIAITLAEVILEKEIEKDNNIIIQQVRKIMDEINNEKVFTIKINPADYDVLIEAKSNLLNANNDAISFIKDDKIDKGSCILHTAIGTIDATFSKQFSKLVSELQNIEKNTMPTKEELIASAIPDITPIPAETLIK
ncbi:MAG: FliH/SctL family protein [Bacteroidetes bacterium]|nr:FliH/SctL family protein [Bacteroidota bacterium]